MIVWLASYPRSGNTFLRIVLNRMYGIRSSVVYDHDGVAERIGADLVGFEERPDDYPALRASGLHFVKTHRRRDHRIEGSDAAICLVRDGRDALVSYARQLSEESPATYETKLRELIEQNAGTGEWGANVLSWLSQSLPNSVLMKFEELIADPVNEVSRAIKKVAPDLRSERDSTIPTFERLAATDALFFRRGQTGAWRDEMPAQLHDLFWQNADNRAAMKLLGYD